MSVKGSKAGIYTRCITGQRLWFLEAELSSTQQIRLYSQCQNVLGALNRGLGWQKVMRSLGSGRCAWPLRHWPHTHVKQQSARMWGRPEIPCAQNGTCAADLPGRVFFGMRKSHLYSHHPPEFLIPLTFLSFCCRHDTNYHYNRLFGLGKNKYVPLSIRFLTVRVFRDSERLSCDDLENFLSSLYNNF